MFVRPIKQVRPMTGTEADSLDVLIVDDDALMRNRLASLLRTLTIKSFEGAPTGKQAVHAYELRRHSVIFLDIDMPGMDGLSTLEALKAIDPDVFVIMLSAHSSASNVKKALELGASGFVVKPYTLGKINEMLRNYLQRQTGRNPQARQRQPG